MKLGKMFFVSLQILSLFQRKSKFRILHNKISWCHWMLRHKTRNISYWITWEVNLASLSHIIKANLLKKNCTLKTSSRPFFCLQRIKQNLNWKMKFVTWATHIRYVTVKLPKFIQINLQTFSDSFLRRILWKLKKGQELPFRQHFWKNFLMNCFLL